MRLRAGTAAAIGALIAAALVAGCAATTDDAPATGSPTGSSPAAAAAPVSADGIDIGHVHNVSVDGDAVLLGSHEGLFRQDPGQPPALVGDPFDVMGFTLDGDRWLSSGHPGPGMDAPADLGLRASTDRGTTWAQVSLAGEADFHRLATSGSTILGVNSGDGLLWRSTGGGAQWATHGAGPFDVALNPADPKHGIATTSSGLLSSRDGGVTWVSIPDAPLIAYVAWTGSEIVGAAPDGKILRSTDGGTTWTRAGAVDGQPSGLAASGQRVLVLQGATLWESGDAGATFSTRITGLPGD